MRELARTRTSAYGVRPDGIYVQVILPGIGKQTLDDAKENVATFNRVAEGTKRLLLVDMREPFATEKGVREYYASLEAARSLERMAMLIGSQASRIIGNFFMSMNQPPFPCRLFNDEASAVAWLKSVN